VPVQQTASLPVEELGEEDQLDSLPVEEELGKEDDYFQLEDVPEQIEAFDPAAQNDILSAMFTNVPRDQDSLKKFRDMPTRNVKLSVLKKQYDRKASAFSLNLLRRRTTVDVDDEATVPTDDKLLMWRVSDHFLDFLLIVPKGPGMDACLPNTEIDNHFQLELDLQPYRRFKAKYGKLGFSPVGRILYMGKCRYEDVWFAMCPNDVHNEAHDDDDNDDDWNRKEANTCMTATHARIITLFIATVLSNNANKGVYVFDSDKYGKDGKLDGWEVSEISNLL
jgi:hypothetical protein